MNRRPSSLTGRLALGCASAVVLALAVPLASSCGNPAIDDKIAALGGERDGVEQGEYHRPGQPCVLCHSTPEGASPDIVVGGTVFSDPTTFQRPVEDVEVILYDAVGDVYTAKTNCIGNFYIEKTGIDPQFPLAAEIRCPTYTADGEKILEDGEPVRKIITMNSWLSRDGSCAGCHSLRGRQVDSVGWLFCNQQSEISGNPYPEVPESCAGKPPREKGQSDEGTP